MNENLDLVEILKKCPKGTKLYSTVIGDVELVRVFRDDLIQPIRIENCEKKIETFVTKDGRMFANCSGECVLFPSREQRDWSKFKPKFDPKTLQPFDKVLVRWNLKEEWRCDLFSHCHDTHSTYKYILINGSAYKYCIPYNEDTKHLVGTTDKAPEFYRHWKD